MNAHETIHLHLGMATHRLPCEIGLRKHFVNKCRLRATKLKPEHRKRTVFYAQASIQEGREPDYELGESYPLKPR